MSTNLSTSRVQAHRDRKRQGLRSVRVELTPDQIAVLIKRNYVEKSKLADDKVLQDAVQLVLFDALIAGTILA